MVVAAKGVRAGKKEVYTVKGIEVYYLAAWAAVVCLRAGTLERAADGLPLKREKDGGTSAFTAWAYDALACLPLVFLATFRHISVGTDTGTVYHPYYYMPYCVFGQRYTGTEAGFYLLIKTGYFLFRSFPGVLFCVALWTSVCFVAALFRTTDKRTVSLCAAYLLAFWYFDSLNIMRQSLAVAIVFLGYSFLKERSPARYALCVLIATCFHNSAPIALSGLWFYYAAEKKPLFWITFSLLPLLVFILPTALTVLEKAGLFVQYIDRYRGTGYDFSLVNFSLVLYRLPVYFLIAKHGKRLYKESRFTRIALLAVIGALGCYLCKIRMVWLARLSAYFLFFEGVLASNCVAREKNVLLAKTLCFLYFAGYFLLAYGVLKNGEIVPFSFVWG